MHIKTLKLKPENKEFIDFTLNVIERHGKELKMHQRKLNEIFEEQKELARLENVMKEQIATVQQQIDEMRPNLPRKNNVYQ